MELLNVFWGIGLSRWSSVVSRPLSLTYLLGLASYQNDTSQYVIDKEATLFLIFIYITFTNIYIL